MEQTKGTALRGRVIEKYGSLSNFAEALGWSARKVSYIVGEKQSPTAKETEEMAKRLDVDNAQDFMRIFYPQMSIKWTDIVA